MQGDRVVPRFCRTCGAPWLPESTECGSCAQRRIGAADASGTGSGEQRPVGSALGLYFTLLSISAVGIIATQGGADELPLDFYLCGAQAVVVLGWCMLSQRSALTGLFKTVHVFWLLAGAGLALATFGIAHLVVGGMTHLTGMPALRYSDPFLRDGFGWGMVVLMVCAHPAIIEELAFRGVVLDSLRRALSPVEAVLVSAGLFSVLHLSPMAFPHTFAMGVVAALLRLRTGSLLPGMALHFVHNFACVGLEWFGWDG